MDGSHKLSPGTNTMSARHTRNAIKNGTVALARFNNGILVMPEATNRLMPIGGVTMPIARLQVMKIPR